MTSMPASRAATAICSAPLEWPSRPGLATSRRGGPPGRARSRSARARSPSEPPATPDAAATPGRGPVLAEHLAQAVGPLAGGAAGPGQVDGGRHDVLVACGPPARSSAEGPVHGGLVTGRPPGLHVGHHLLLHRRVDLEDVVLAARAVTGGRLGEGVHARSRSGRPTRCGACARCGTGPAGPSARRWPRRRRRGPARRRARPGPPPPGRT